MTMSMLSRSRTVTRKSKPSVASYKQLRLLIEQCKINWLNNKVVIFASILHNLIISFSSIRLQT